MRPLFKFHGGISLQEHKKDSTTVDVATAQLPKLLVLPLQQHIGKPAEPIVSVGEKVLKGQLIARPTNIFSAPVHASSSGTIVAIGHHAVPHPSGLTAPCISIKTDGEDKWRPRQKQSHDYHDLSRKELRDIIRDAGIVGLGGGGFPSFIKLNPSHNPVDTLILNGAECEPYITCDELLLRKHAKEVIIGMRMMRHVLNTKRCIIAVEDNKPLAFDALCEQVRDTDADFIEIIQVPTIYPTGGERQLIHVLTGKEVPSGGLPIDIGIVCHNVSTAYAVYKAVELDEPLISRYVTIAGSVPHTCNMEILIGTPVSNIIDECDGNRYTLSRIIMGGPMMGMAIHTDEIPVIKTTNCLLINAKITEAPLVSRNNFALPCIRCSNCASACPVNLLPQQLYWYARAKDFDKIQDYNLFDCIECGCCDYVCPSQIPLVHYFRYAKTQIWAQDQENKLSGTARERHEFRELRIEREKQERANRHKQKRAALDKKKGDTDEDPKKIAIQAAMERAKEKREEDHVQPQKY